MGTGHLLGAVMLGVFAFSLPGFSLFDRILFHPSPGADIGFDDLGISGEERMLETEDGVRIHAYVLPRPGATRALLFFHGNAGNASHRLPNAMLLSRLGATVLLLDYRGYGRSEGRPTVDGLQADARAGLAYLSGPLGFPEDRIVLFGRSLGAAVAVELARGRPLAGVILESAFTSTQAMAKKMLGSGFGWITRGRFDSLSNIGELRSPLLSFHGDRDQLIPYAQGRELYEAAPEPKSFSTIRGAGHNDTVQVGRKPYFDRIQRFLDEVAPEDAPQPIER